MGRKEGKRMELNEKNGEEWKGMERRKERKGKRETWEREEVVPNLSEYDCAFARATYCKTNLYSFCIDCKLFFVIRS